MKKEIGALTIGILFLFSCGPETPKEETKTGDSVGLAKMRENDTLPHEVSTGTGADYAYKPDTCIKKLVLANPKSWLDFYKENGAAMFDLSNGFSAACYFNSRRTEEMQVGLVENSKGEKVVYSMIVQKFGDDKSPSFAPRPIPASDLNFISGSGIYLGMSQEYVMGVYTDQKLIQQQKCDTTFLVFNPKPKDKNFYRRYSWKSYTATYKFVDNELKRMEYNIDPSEFTKHE